MTSRRAQVRGDKLKPIIAVSSNSIGDIEKGRRSLIEALQCEGYRVLVLAADGGIKVPLAIEGAGFYSVPMEPRGLSPLADLATLLAYRRKLRRIGARAFLGFTIKPNIYGSLAARSLGLKRINNITGLGVMFARSGPIAALVRSMYRVALRGAETVFFQNHDDRDLFLAAKLVRKGQAWVLPGSGVNLDRFKPTKPATSKSEITFLLAGRLLWDKGIREFVSAARALRSRRSDFRFQILGVVEPPSRDAVPLADLEKWSAEGIVDFLGAADDVRPHFAAADCIVLPSYYREGVPRVLLEGAAMGRPLITANSPGCREAVDDGINGYVCEPRSTESLVNTLARFAELSRAQWTAMGEAGRKKMEREFDERFVHRAYLDALARVFVDQG